jgi:hypothetical protein
MVAEESVKGENKIVKSFISGGCAGVVSKTLIAPI